MENLKSEPFDEREEGEISLDDVSSSEETHYSNCNKNSKKSGIGKKYIKREVDILSQDADHGKENRRFSNELIGTTSKPLVATLQEKNDDLLPISSEEDIEFVGLPGTSKQFAIHTGLKKKRKKKKKKKSGPRMLVLDDLVSIFDDEPEGVGVVPDNRRDFNVSRSYGDINGRSPSPLHRMNSPPRHIGWHLPRSPVRHYHSPLKHGRSPIRRSPSPRQRAPRKFLSPRKSPAFNSDRRVSHKPPRGVSPGRYNDAYASSLLKKVRHLETVGSITPVNQQKYRESSLKDKLSNMMIKSLPQTKENVNSWQCEIGDSQSIGIKADDDEDLELLRRNALETKQLKNDTQSKEEINTTYVKSSVDNNTNVSNDEDEDLELRMIALRSAVMKKHHDRVQRGHIKKKSGTDIKDESPFSDNFLDSLDSYLDGSTDVGYNENQVITSSIAQLSNAENVHVEDMDLDSDVEREKENSQPYSPTDELSPRTFIEPNFPDASLTETSIHQFPTQNINENLTNIIVSPYSGSSTVHFDDHMANVVSPYSPSDPTSTPRTDNASRQESPLTTRDPRIRRHINSNGEISYSPNDTVALDPTLPVCPPNISFARTPCNTHVNARLLNSQNLIVVPFAKNPINPTEMSPVSQQQSTLSWNSNVTTESHVMQTLHTKETNAVIGKVQSDITYDDIIRDLAEYTGEPLYLQGVPDITKDANKIPTLVNRTLVPVPILKTNKQLQQPLPNKKPDGNGEPSFKSADMLPVNVQSHSIKSSTVFKPIKVQSVAKKNQVMIPPAAAFNNFLNDETSAVLSNASSSKIVGNPNSASGNKCSEIPVNLITTDASESVMLPGSESKTKVRRSRTPRNTAEIAEKTRRKINASRVSTIVANETMNEKITIKRNSKITNNKNNQQRSNTYTGEVKKSDVDTKKNDSVKKSDPKRGKRSKSIARSDDESYESLKNNLNETKNNDTAKQKKEITKKMSKIKTTKRSESNSKNANVVNGNINKSMTIGSNDKNRRSSVDEDEETLRAALLASLPKRMKISDPQISTTAFKLTVESAQSIKKSSSGIKALSKEKQRSGTTSMLPPVTVPLQSGSNQKTVGQSKITAITASGVGTTKKRSSTLNDQGPSKKIVKNTATSSIDTTKMLTVAEKIVENEIQRKLSQQQAAIDLLSSKAQQSSKINLPRLSIKDSIASISPKISASKNMDRMIIRLGEDSDSDSDENDGTTITKTKNINMPFKETSKAPIIPVTDFEKSVEEFLRSQREKQESSTTSTNTTAKLLNSALSKETSPLTNTPLAVRHLPASQQEEYRRLKQCIAEREQQKMNRTAQTITKNHVQAISPNEESSTSTASTSIIAANDTISTINTQTKSIIPSTDETQKIPLDPLYKPMVIQTQIGRSALELLQPKLNVETFDDNANKHISESPLLQDIPIKSDPSLFQTTCNIIGDNQNVENTTASNTLHNNGVSDLESIGPMLPNLTISFANTRDDSIPCIRHVRIVGRNDISKVQSSPPQDTPLGIRILTTDQLNMKYEHTETDIIDYDMLMSRNRSENIDTHPIDESITIEQCKVETNGDVADPSTLNYQPTVDLTPLTLHTIKQDDCSSTHSNNDGLDTTIEFDSTIIFNPTTVINDIESTVGTVLNTPMNNTSASLQDAELSTETELPVREQLKKLPEMLESDVQEQLETLCNLPDDQQRIQLTTIEKRLVAKRYVVLHNLTHMAEDLQQWEIQSNLAADVKRLKKELQMAEERLQVQRVKTMKMSPVVTQVHNTINQGRDECMKLMKLCQGIGSKIMGPAYKIPSTGGLLLKEKLREVANMTKQLSKNKVSTIDVSEVRNSDTITKLTSDNSCNENSDFNLQSTDHNVETNQHSASVKIENFNDSEVIMANTCANSSNETLLNVPMENNVPNTNEVTETKNNVTFFASDNSPLDHQLVENTDNGDISTYDRSWFKTENENPPIQPAVSYESVLTSFNTPRHMDPNGVLCPYELMGTCSDEACSYNHLDASRS